MKSYQSETVNGGVTIILDSVQEAIKLGQSYVWKREKQQHNNFDESSYIENFKKAINEIVKGDPELKKKVDEIIDDVIPLVDNICPLFSQEHSGYKRTDDGFHTTADLVALGEELCTFKKKETPFKLKRGKGEGAYRLLINTDVSWWGNAAMNCAMVGALILVLQRYAPVEIWIQQGWLAKGVKDKSSGITLFKLNYEGAWDVTNLAFWITSQYKDFPFSFIINRALGRQHTCTSVHAEIECDMMLRGDWQTLHGFEYWKEMLYTEQLDMISNYIANTGMKILCDNPEEFGIKVDPITGEPL